MSTNADTPIQPLTATIGVERKVAMRDYNNIVASIYLPVEIPRQSDFDGDLEAYYKALDGAVRTGFTSAKGLVFEQLGIEYEDKNGVLIEKLASSFAGATEVQSGSRPAQRATAPASAPAAGAPSVCPKCNGAEFYDNREAKASGKYKANAPDFKCKGCSNGVWLTKKGS